MFNSINDQNDISPILRPVLPPISGLSHLQQSRQNLVSAPYDLPLPELIPDSDDGYASLPQSPLDYNFPSGVGTNGALASSALSQNICGRSYVDVHEHDIVGQQQSPVCFDESVGIDISGLSGMQYVSA